jgi:potassium/hydrogen antiporter
MDILTSYNLIIAASTIIICSFFFSELASKTNIPSVLMLIFLGILIKFGMQALNVPSIDFLPVLEILGIVGLIMIVLEASLELQLKREKLGLIIKALAVALVCLFASAWIAALILHHFVPQMTMQKAWIYAMPLSILSSAIVIPSVAGLSELKKEFHVYESTFCDIVGIMVFYYLTEQIEHSSAESGGGLGSFFFSLLFTIGISIVASYAIIFIFQNIKSHVKLFLLIAVLLLLYSLCKKMHLSSLLIILTFGVVISNVRLFFQGILGKWLNFDKAKHIYENLHVITIETAFVVRTFFFVIFGLTIVLSTLLSAQVALISILIIASIYFIRFLILSIVFQSDIHPQVFIAPRGLITILLFYAIPKDAIVADFNPAILLFIIIGTSVIMTFALISDKRKTSKALREAESLSVGYVKWKMPTVQIEKKEVDV